MKVFVQIIKDFILGTEKNCRKYLEVIFVEVISRTTVFDLLLWAEDRPHLYQVCLKMIEFKVSGLGILTILC